MVGYYQTPNYGAFLRQSNGTSSTFNVPNDGLTTQALGINNAGVIVGSYFDSTVDGHITGYIYRNGQLITDIDPPGSHYSYLTDINDLGTAVGWYLDSNNGTHGFIMTGAVDLPEPGTIGLGSIGLGVLIIASPAKGLETRHERRTGVKKSTSSTGWCNNAHRIEMRILEESQSTIES